MADKTVPAVRARKIAVLIARVVTYLLYFYLIVVEIILFIGFFLLLFGANPDAGFTEWAYRNLDRVMEPFRGIFTPIELGTTNGNVESVFETSVLFAMIIYGILVMALSALMSWLKSRLQYLERAEATNERLEEQAQYEAEQQAAADAAAAAAAAAAAPVPAIVPATPVAERTVTATTTVTPQPPTSVPSVPPPPPPTGS